MGGLDLNLRPSSYEPGAPVLNELKKSPSLPTEWVWNGYSEVLGSGPECIFVAFADDQDRVAIDIGRDRLARSN